MYVIPHPFISKGVVCIYHCVESLTLLDVSLMAEQVLRLLRREARVMTIGFTLFYAQKLRALFFLKSSFHVKCLTGAYGAKTINYE